MADTPTVTQTTATPAAAPAPAPQASAPAAASVAPPAQTAEATPAETASAAKQEAAAIARRLKLKLDGAEYELPEEEVVRLAQMGAVSGKRFQEASALRKQAETVLEMLTKTPAAALKKVMDPKAYRDMLEQELMEIVKREAETPEAKEKREMQEKLKSYEQRERETAEAAEKQKQEAAAAAKAKAEQDKMNEWVKKFDAVFTDALGKADLPKNAYTVKRMVELQRVNLKKGLNLDADSLAKIVREDYAAELKHWVGAAEGDKLLDILGTDLTGKISKAQIRKLKSANQQKFTNPDAVQTPAPSQSQGPTRWRDLSKARRRLQG